MRIPAIPGLPILALVWAAAAAAALPGDRYFDGWPDDVKEWKVIRGEWRMRDGVYAGKANSAVELPGKYFWGLEFSATYQLDPGPDKSTTPFNLPASRGVFACFCFGSLMVECSEAEVQIVEYAEGVSRQRLAEAPLPGHPAGRDHHFHFSFSSTGLRIQMDGAEIIQISPFSYNQRAFPIRIVTGESGVRLHRLSLSRTDAGAMTSRNGALAVRAIYRPRQFNQPAGLMNHHFIVAQQGKASWLGLFNTLAGDLEIHDALVSLGAQPGNNSSEKAWTLRMKREAPEPDVLPTGSPLRISIWGNGAWYQPPDFLRDSLGSPFDFRFSGNKSLIARWGSGCVACLQGCPGGKIGHARYSIRHLVDQKARFAGITPPGLADGDTVHIVFQPFKPEE
jgi:hypothetical protein